MNEEVPEYIQNSAGPLSNTDIEALLNKDIVISNYDEDNLTDLGYNFTPTEFIFSVNKKLLMPIYCKNGEKYCWVNPHDTVLILTRESIWVSNKILGTFHSKVKLVSQGFGHISTTLDPNWEGPLLISLNNPINNKLRFVIGKDTGSGYKESSFVTLIFYKLVSPSKKVHDNPPCRWDILNQYVRNQKYHFWNHKRFEDFRNLVEDISNFKNKEVGLGSPTDEKDKFIDKVECFKKTYINFEKELHFKTRQAQEISKKINRVSDIIYLIGKAFLLILVVAFLGVGIYFQFNNNDDMAKIFMSLFTVCAPFILTLVFKRREDK